MQTVNLELSRKLKEAGYPQENPIFSFVAYGKEFEGDEKPKHTNGFRSDEFVWVASPTCDEILEQLPDYIRNPENGDLTPLWFCRNKYTKDFIAQYHIAFSAPLYEQRADTLADVMAKMWLYLKENNLLPTQSERK